MNEPLILSLISLSFFLSMGIQPGALLMLGKHATLSNTPLPFEFFSQVTHVSKGSAPQI